MHKHLFGFATTSLRFALQPPSVDTYSRNSIRKVVLTNPLIHRLLCFKNLLRTLLCWDRFFQWFLKSPNLLCGEVRGRDRERRKDIERERWKRERERERERERDGNRERERDVYIYIYIFIYIYGNRESYVCIYIYRYRYRGRERDREREG